MTHNHPEGVKGAQTVATAIFLARTGQSKDEITQYIEGRFIYNLRRTVDETRPGYHFDVTCQGSVPEAIIAFLDSTDYEDAVRKAVSLGGNSDTLACMAGGVAQAFYGDTSDYIAGKVRELFGADLLDIVDEFNRKYGLCER